MVHGLSSYLNSNHHLTTAWLDKVARAGVEVVELFCARQSLDYRNPAQIAELGYWFRDSPLRPHSLHLPLYSDDCGGRTGPQASINICHTERDRRRDSVDEIKRALEIAEQVPCGYAIQHLGTGDETYEDRKLDAAFSSLEELNVFARDRGIEILLENIPNALSSAERLLEFLEQTHLDNFLCFDIGHAHLGEGVEPAFERMKDRIRSTHIHDNDGSGDTHGFPQSGSIDWPAAMRLLRSRQSQYPLLLELREPVGGSNPLDMVLQTFDQLEELE